MLLKVVRKRLLWGGSRKLRGSLVGRHHGDDASELESSGFARDRWRREIARQESDAKIGGGWNERWE